MNDELDECWRDVRVPPHDRIYEGTRDAKGNCRVRVAIGQGRPKPLPLYLSVMKHSPTGFEWGYSGSGPAQLALALLVDALGKDQKDRVLRLHQAFKRAVVAPLPQSKWTLTRKQVLEVVARLESGGADR